MGNCYSDPYRVQEEENNIIPRKQKLKNLFREYKAQSQQKAQSNANNNNPQDKKATLSKEFQTPEQGLQQKNIQTKEENFPIEKFLNPQTLNTYN